MKVRESILNMTNLCLVKTKIRGTIEYGKFEKIYNINLNYHVDALIQTYID
jgi:hypothetical protein